MADTVSPSLVTELAPKGRLRAAINFGNSVLAQQDPAGGEPRGVSAELARELARRLGVGIGYVTFDAAGKVFEALKAGLWDIAFLAIDPVRSAGIAFTAPYVVIEGTYVVPKDSPLRTIEDVDRDGVRVAVAQGSAYDLYLTRALRRAELVRQQLLCKPRLALLIPQDAIRYRSRRGHTKRFAQRGKIYISGIILPVNDLLGPPKTMIAIMDRQHIVITGHAAKKRKNNKRQQAKKEYRP